MGDRRKEMQDAMRGAFNRPEEQPSGPGMFNNLLNMLTPSSSPEIPEAPVVNPYENMGKVLTDPKRNRLR